MEVTMRRGNRLEASLARMEKILSENRRVEVMTAGNRTTDNTSNEGEDAMERRRWWRRRGDEWAVQERSFVPCYGDWKVKISIKFCFHRDPILFTVHISSTDSPVHLPLHIFTFINFVFLSSLIIIIYLWSGRWSSRCLMRLISQRRERPPPGYFSTTYVCGYQACTKQVGGQPYGVQCIYLQCEEAQKCSCRFPNPGDRNQKQDQELQQPIKDNSDQGGQFSIRPVNSSSVWLNQMFTVNFATKSISSLNNS